MLIYMHIYVYVSVQTIMLYTLNLYRGVCHLYLNETKREGKNSQVLSKHGKGNRKVFSLDLNG